MRMNQFVAIASVFVCLSVAGVSTKAAVIIDPIGATASDTFSAASVTGPIY